MPGPPSQGRCSARPRCKRKVGRRIYSRPHFETLLVAVREVFAAKGAEIVGIGIDQAAKVEEFARTYGVTYPVLIAEADAIELMRRLGNALGGLPYTVVVDRVGAVAHRRLGALTRAEVEGVLEGLLR